MGIAIGAFGNRQKECNVLRCVVVEVTGLAVFVFEFVGEA
jgi:hypothetical protein